MLNWHRPERRWLLLGAAVTFYVGRIASALYFAPHALAWATTRPAPTSTRYACGPT